jgi:hypothetical protein
MVVEVAAEHFSTSTHHFSMSQLHNEGGLIFLESGLEAQPCGFLCQKRTWEVYGSV